MIQKTNQMSKMKLKKLCLKSKIKIKIVKRRKGRKRRAKKYHKLVTNVFFYEQLNARVDLDIFFVLSSYDKND